MYDFGNKLIKNPNVDHAYSAFKEENRRKK